MSTWIMIELMRKARQDSEGRLIRPCPDTGWDGQEITVYQGYAMLWYNDVETGSTHIAKVQL